MVTVASKLLLLAGLLLGSIESVASLRDGQFRGLGTKGEYSLSPTSSKSKSGKSGKDGTGKSGKSTEKTDKASTGKGGEALHVGSDLTVEYTVVEHSTGKNSKDGTMFEYTETGQKIDKSSKPVYDNGSGGDKSGKTSKSGDHETNEDTKADGYGSTTKETKSGGANMKGDGEKLSKDSKSSGGSSAGSTKVSKSNGGSNGSTKESKSSKDSGKFLSVLSNRF